MLRIDYCSLISTIMSNFVNDPQELRIDYCSLISTIMEGIFKALSYVAD